MKVLSLFSGIGAFEKALEKLEIQYELVGFSEIDKYAIKSYCAIHGVDESLNLGDITKIDINKLPKDIDFVVGGFPCQTFSIAGNRKGFEDMRGTMCFYMANIIKQTKPKYFMFENVQGLLNHDKGRTIRIILEEFSKLGYEITMDLLNAKDFRNSTKSFSYILHREEIR